MSTRLTRILLSAGVLLLVAVVASEAVAINSARARNVQPGSAAMSASAPDWIQRQTNSLKAPSSRSPDWIDRQTASLSLASSLAPDWVARHAQAANQIKASSYPDWVERHSGQAPR